jgi:alcohol dehydrogenase
MRKLGATDRIVGLLAPREVSLYDRVEENPSLESIEAGLALAREKNIEAVVALGGGSGMDAGKAIAFLAPQSKRLRDLLAAENPAGEAPPLPFVAVPTTAGTGSEATPFASLWDKTNRRKLSLTRDAMFPACAIVDPQLTRSAPPAVTAATGLDALCHAVEAYWSRSAQPVSDALAERAIGILLDNLQSVYDRPDEMAAREAMALGSLLAGLAFSNTKTSSCHSISYPLTARFEIPHGIACAITLGPTLAFNAPVLGAKGDRLAALLGCESLADAPRAMAERLKRLGVPPRLRDHGLAETDLDAVLGEAFTPDRMANNPRDMDRQAVRRLLEGVL